MLSDEIVKRLENQLKEISSNMKDDDTIDFLVLDIVKWEIIPRNYVYDYQYDQYGEEIGGPLIIDSDIPQYRYMFDSSLLNPSEMSYFLNNIDRIIACRDKVEKADDTIGYYAEEIDEKYDYRPYVQIAYDLAQEKGKILYYKNDDDYNERYIESNLQKGMLVLDAEDVLSFELFDDWEDSGSLFNSHKVDTQNLKENIIQALSCYYKLNLLYPTEYYTEFFSCNKENFQNTEIQNIENMEDDNSTTVSVALKGNKVSVIQSLGGKYEGTDTPIIYLSLSKLYKEQEFLVMSESCAQEYLSKENDEARKDYLSKCQVVYSKEAGCYGIIRPSSARTIAKYEF